MTEKTLDTQNSERAERLDQLLTDLAAKGFAQRQIAAELNVPPNYLSDLRHGRRTATDQLCRSFAHQFQISYQWLAAGEGAISSPQIGPLLAKAAGNLLLPVLSEPHVGDPRQCERWDGCQAEVTGAAAAAAGRATNPYIIRLSGQDYQGRLKAGDLILVSQEATETGDMAIARHRNRLMIVRKERKEDNGRWLALSSGKPLTGKHEIVGQCLGIVWAGL